MLLGQRLLDTSEEICKEYKIFTILKHVHIVIFKSHSNHTRCYGAYSGEMEWGTQSCQGTSSESHSRDSSAFKSIMCLTSASNVQVSASPARLCWRIQALGFNEYGSLQMVHPGGGRRAALVQHDHDPGKGQDMAMLAAR